MCSTYSEHRGERRVWRKRIKRVGEGLIRFYVLEMHPVMTSPWVFQRTLVPLSGSTPQQPRATAPAGPSSTPVEGGGFSTPLRLQSPERGKGTRARLEENCVCAAPAPESLTLFSNLAPGRNIYSL